MLRSLRDLCGYTIAATDGDIGHVRNFFLDDRLWAVRYLVVETGSWLQSRRVLIAPASLGRPDQRRRVLPVLLTREQIKNSPDVDGDKPVSRQQEILMNQYYGWPYYWTGAAAGPIVGEPAAKAGEPAGDPRLRSAREVTGYHIHAADGRIGEVMDFLADDVSWAVRNLVVDTGNWLSGKQVLLAPQWVQRVSWPAHEVLVSLTRERIEKSPEYDPPAVISQQVWDRYGRPPEPTILRVLQSRTEIRAFYDKIAKVYDLLAERAEHAVRQAALGKLAAAPGERILEIGSGTGHCLVALAKAVGRMGRVFGVDLSQEMLRTAGRLLRRKRLASRVDLQCGDAVSLPYCAGVMDGVFMSFALELFDTPEIPVVLGECERVLKPGGRLAVVGLSKEGEQGLVMEAFEWTHRHFPNFLDCRPIFVRRSIEEAGFAVQDSTRMRMWVPVEVVLARKTQTQQPWTGPKRIEDMSR